MQDLLSNFKSTLARRIADSLPADDSPLSQAMRYSVGTSGKLYRPLFCFCAGLGLGAQESDLITTGVALELLHNFTLVHDDIMDAAQWRRGRPTVHVQWGTNLAILTGDALFARSLEILLSLENQKAPAMEVFIRGLPALSRGQAIDLEQLEPVALSVADYKRMAAWKTGTLFAMAGEMAAVLAEAHDDTRLLMRELGLSLGIAYQLKDDYLDFFGAANIMGKSAGSDLMMQRRSLVMALGFQEAPEDLRRAVGLARSDTQMGLMQARRILVDTGVERKIREQLAAWVAECQQLLLKLNFDTKALRSLLSLMFDSHRDTP